MSLHAILAEAKRALMASSGVSRVFHKVSVIVFSMSNREVTLKDEEVGKVTLKDISVIEPMTYISGVLIYAHAFKRKPKSPKVVSTMRLEFDYPTSYAYVVVKGDRMYLFDGPYCNEYPENCEV